MMDEKSALKKLLSTPQLAPSKVNSLGKTLHLVLYGPPCSGKTTLGRLLSTIYNINRIAMDQLRSILIPKPKFTPEESSELFEILLSYVDCMLSMGGGVLCEGFFASSSRRERLRKLSTIHNAVYICAYVTADPEVLHNRLNVRQMLGHNSEGSSPESLSHHVLDEYLQLFSNPQDAVVIDTGKQNIKESMQHIILAIKKAETL